MSDAKQTRTATVTLDPLFFQTVAGNETLAQQAIGYMLLWALGGTYTSVNLYGDAAGNLDAVYERTDGRHPFCMGGIRSADGTYSFHS